MPKKKNQEYSKSYDISEARMNKFITYFLYIYHKKNAFNFNFIAQL